MKIASRFTFLFILLILLSAFALGSVCDSPVTDGAGMLGGKLADVQTAATKLSSQGADVRIITFSSLGGYANMDALAMATVKSCPAMQSPNGGVKSNLVIIAVAPHAFGLFAGKGYEDAFGAAQMGRWKKDYMLPHFKAGEFADGLIAPADQMAERLKAFNSEANAPVTNTTTTVNQASAPTDLHGLWVFFWIIGLVIAAIVVFLIIRARRVVQDAIEQTQQNAIAARDEAANLISELGAEAWATMTDFTGKPGLKHAADLFNTASASYSRLAGNLSADPTAPGLGKGTYESLTVRYNGITSYLDQAKDAAADPEVGPSKATVRSVDSSAGYYGSSSSTRRTSHHTKMSAPRVYQDSAPSAPAPVSNDSGLGFVEGAIVGDLIGSSSRSDREERYEAPAPSYSEPAEDKEEDAFTTSSSSNSYERDPDPTPSFTDSSASESFSTPDVSMPDFSSGSGGDTF